MKKTNKTTLITLILIVIVSNLAPFQYFFQERYHYQNKNGSFQFTEQPGMGRDLNVALMQFSHFKSEHPSNPNTILYRTFTIKPWHFWEWWQFIAHCNRFALPYLKQNL